ncbi:CTP synthase [Candidatus Beckwithbacteria bacterium CG10_big_fil_rev_8_21_14_0_10_34_10]|uniref:CTP synthase n=1 Tax=Candidatus Beckwithbacteria bacterium CG10_big_fil_rev_8_21_14_0_10_34_10 TaxID=1974495 RepID=A0A2H0WAB1_9BACT|nr:MAG: CTP synthase [Candidatus Beckwithbacteria bacterium CG10_big_fil_rev_8_21_14_0_10_34_10]
MKKYKYIFVSGGVISGLGKGITASSIGLLLKAQGFKVALVKCDPYVNIDAGTIRPQEHGEVFVTNDGIESDQDLGHYERFLNEDLTRAHYITTGQIYKEVIRKERNFEYNGEDVEVVPHVPEEMIRRFKLAGKASNADVVIIEIGGTVGEYQNILFLEANRIMKMRDKEKVIHVHVAYLPTPPSIGEMKSKPVQLSVRLLAQTGIQPDFLVARAEKPIDQQRKDRISLFCNIEKEDIFSNPYVPITYEVPLIFKEQGFDKKIMEKLKLKGKNTDLLNNWKKMVKRVKKAKKKIKIAVAGKYQTVGDYILPDSYVCVLEALRHAAWHYGYSPEIVWLNTEKIEKDKSLLKRLDKVDGIIIPQGWGSRGVEGKIMAIEYARVNNLPFLGLCFGMQMAVIEYARNVLKLKNANSEEVDPKTPYPVIHIMPKQIEYLKKKQYGGTIRLGAWPCKVKKNTELFKMYGKENISERHRHRYEFNSKYKVKFQKKGLVISGVSPDGKLVEAIELPKQKHPFFQGVQFHPEFKSRPLTPHPVFMGFIKAAIKS